MRKGRNGGENGVKKRGETKENKQAQNLCIAAKLKQSQTKLNKVNSLKFVKIP